MFKVQSVTSVLKLLALLIVLFILIHQCWLIINNSKIHVIGTSTARLGSVQAVTFQLNSDLVQLRESLENKRLDIAYQLIDSKTQQHKAWLKTLIRGLNSQDSLVEFSEQYLMYIKELKDGKIETSFGTRRLLLDLLTTHTQRDHNLVTLTQKHTANNLLELKQHLKWEKVNLIIQLLALCCFCIIITALLVKQRKKMQRAERLSLFFLNHPNILLRLSPTGNIRYYNHQASKFMKLNGISKFKLLPEAINSKMAKVLKQPGKTIRFPHQIGETKLYCDFRLSPESGQVFVMLNIQRNEVINAHIEAEEGLTLTG
ncbi:hypothetical protein [Psychrobium sp. 1_MG-2023]|uniref:hypothetical protein n=1 Tax=Psychrobium sp. 1_MG-2023 TaxID=3062624 RepID=UPI000C3233DF|nr:hypothetical protein [Psychrobium sp. 1_MG-2023]MDP2562069.1 hypothetical protein [Psychrobium sp. 1_MG-2023]PKF58553.1 hypothetical protein CW748_03685 [Alteromonadales bacterium alter-6D02]